MVGFVTLRDFVLGRMFLVLHALVNLEFKLVSRLRHEKTSSSYLLV